ncbi:SaV-like [uncultured Caudovirales phage]|uniref:SaV-like n=1 Tax=uncultured Caudovirales phage TaxID=2100421 RepID=A0A6J5RUA0_9CAUD|nr:SaV-like [uncultured Caudovirales phage]
MSATVKCEHGLIMRSVCEQCKQEDRVDRPPHYTSHPSGVECIEVTEHMNFNLGNAIKYIWRADLKGKSVEDLSKAGWYIAREIQRIKTR